LFYGLSTKNLNETTFAQGEDVDLLLFCQDYPITVEVDSRYETETLPFPMTHKDYTELFSAPADCTDNMIFHEAAPAVDLLEQARGYTVTNNVDVWGYLYQGTVLNRGIGTGDAPFVPATAKLWVTVFSSAQVRFGPPQFRQTGIAVWAPIILAETEYTAAMAANHNQIVDTIGGIPYVIEIVGLYMKGTR
jgi:hypothetical protein